MTTKRDTRTLRIALRPDDLLDEGMNPMHRESPCPALPGRRALLAAGLSSLALALTTGWPRPAAAQTLAEAGDFWWLDRLSWGATPDSLESMRRLGRDGWLARQLAPRGDARLPDAAERMVTALDISRMSLHERIAEVEALRLEPKRLAAQASQAAPADEEGMADKAGKKGARMKNDDAEQRKRFRRRLRELGQEAQSRALLRAAYSPDQLQEQMVWFWMNHFSINGRSGLLQLWLPDYEDRAIRPHALGRFRDLLEAVITHPAMLIYLNNNTNAAGRINENLARELMELHTMGVDGGYTQADVQSLARVLTGLGVQRHAPEATRHQPGTVTRVEGFTVFSAARHEPGRKHLLGQPLPGGGWDEIQAMLDRLASHPSTARHVARQLARHFVGESPSDALLGRMAHRFQETDGQLAEVVKVMAMAPEFEQSLDRRFKLPVHYLVSAWRLLWPDPASAPETRRALSWLDRLGQPMYARSTPDGFPADASYWNGSGQMITRFELAKLWAGLAVDQPDGVPVPDQWLAPTLGSRTKNVLASAKDQRERLAWLLSSPEFMTR